MKNETLTLEIDSNLKTELESICHNEVSDDMFYSPSNIAYLEKVTAYIDAGTAKLSEHELIGA